MIYLLESELSENKYVHIALTQIYGVGKRTSFMLCKQLGFSKNLKIKSLSDDQVNSIIKFIESLDSNFASDLKKTKQLIFKNLLSIKSYRGFRRYQGLPTRGQRTHTNAKTAKKRKSF